MRGPNHTVCRAAAVLGVGAALGGGAYVAEAKLDESGHAGTQVSYPPRKQHCEPLSQNTVVGTWNMANELPARINDIKRLIYRNHLGVLSLQEVRPAAIPRLRKALGCYSVSYVLADGKEEGKGNAILVRGPVRDVTSFRINDKSYAAMAANAYVDHLKRNLKYSALPMPLNAFATVSHLLDFNANAATVLSDNKIVEKRAALAVTTDLTIDGQTVPTQFITGHIGRQNSVREPQLARLMGFIRYRARKNHNTVFCGDLNTQPSEMLGFSGTFAKSNFYATRTAHTYVKSTSNIDYCAQDRAGQIDLTHTRRISNPHTDHYPEITTTGSVHELDLTGITQPIVRWGSDLSRQTQALLETAVTAPVN